MTDCRTLEQRKTTKTRRTDPTSLTKLQETIFQILSRQTLETHFTWIHGPWGKFVKHSETRPIYHVCVPRKVNKTLAGKTCACEFGEGAKRTADDSSLTD